MAFRLKQKTQINTKIKNLENQIYSIKNKLDENNIDFDENNLLQEIEELNIREKELNYKLNNKDEDKQLLEINIEENIITISNLKKNIIIEKNNYDKKNFDEESIYNNEIERINNKKKEFINNNSELLNKFEEEYLSLFNKIELNKKEINNINIFLKKFIKNKQDSRNSYVELMMKHNHIKKNLKNDIRNINIELNKINERNNYLNTLINNYDNLKYKINEENYQWLNDIKDTKDKIISIFNDLNIDIKIYLEQDENTIFDVDVESKLEKINDPLYLSNQSIHSKYEIELYKRIKILKNHLKKLKTNDYRMNSKMRYISLDDDFKKWTIELKSNNIKIKDLQLKKQEINNKNNGTKYIMDACNFFNFNKEDYCSKKKRILDINEEQIKLKLQYDKIKLDVNNYKTIIKNKEYPKAIFTDEERCINRKKIILERLEKTFNKNKSSIENKIKNIINENSKIYNQIEELNKLENNTNEKDLLEEKESILFVYNLKKEFVKLKETLNNLREVYNSI